MRHGWLGLALVAVFWWLNWSLDGLRTHWGFFPMWLGYVLFVDGLTWKLRGSSLFTRSRRGFVLTFLVSMPVWWMFELFNMRLGNWEYLGRERFGDVEYFLLSSLSFSTVLPAVLGTAELVRGTKWIERFAHGPRIAPSPLRYIGSWLAGAVMLAAMLAWPRYGYPLLWVSGVFLLEPVCMLLGRRSLLFDLQRGDWRPWVSLWTGVLICAFFWEMWNFRSYPKWIYHVPGVGFGKVFEMPVLGYLGYLPFSLELWLLAHLLLPRGLSLRL